MAAHGSALTTPEQECRLRQLADRMAHGDREAVAALYDETSPVLYGLTFRILGDPAEAEEALCEAYKRAWAQIKSYNPDQIGLLVWLVLLTRTVALERQKSRSARTPAPVDGPANVVLSRLDPSARRTVESAFFGGAGTSRDEVRAAFGRLRSMLQKGDTVQ